MQTPPVAIGGIGGSGTRVVVEILQDLGYYLGNDLNAALDNLMFTLLFKRRSLWPTESHRAEIEGLVALFLNLMTHRYKVGEAGMNLLKTCVAEATTEHPAPWREQRQAMIFRLQEESGGAVGRWGWKEPNTHIFLRELKTSIPDLKYVHVMRHGVDMALSVNQNQLKLWGEGLLGREVVIGPGDSLRYWCVTHRRLLAIKKEMPEHLLLLDFDRLCEEPDEGLHKLALFLGVELEGSIKDQLLKKIRSPKSLGRYQKADRTLFAEEDLEFVREMGFVV
jgi:hypothetical protein